MKTTKTKETAELKGVVVKQLYSAEGYRKLRNAINRGMPRHWIEKIEKEAIKPLFRENFVWRFLNKVLSIDIKIPFLTGIWTLDPIIHNTIPTRGKQIVAEQAGGTTAAPVTAVAIGIGTPSATALGSEISSGGGSRGAATVSNETTTTTGDTEQWIKSFTFSSSFAVTEEGLFDNNGSGGNMLASQSFSVINVVSGDVLQITHKVQVT